MVYKWLTAGPPDAKPLPTTTLVDICHLNYVNELWVVRHKNLNRLRLSLYWLSLSLNAE